MKPSIILLHDFPSKVNGGDFRIVAGFGLA